MSDRPCFTHALKFPKENECTWCQIESLQAKVEALEGEIKEKDELLDEFIDMTPVVTSKHKALQAKVEALDEVGRYILRCTEGGPYQGGSSYLIPIKPLIRLHALLTGGGE